MEKQQTPFVLTDGEKLSILFTRDGRSIDELAKAWGKNRSTLWRYQATPKLKKDVIKKACEILSVPESVFDRRLNADNLLRLLDEMQDDIQRLKDAKASQESINIALIERVQQLEAENKKLKILQN